MRYLASFVLAALSLTVSMEAMAQAHIRPGGRQVTKQIKCESWDENYAECAAGGPIVAAALAARHSKTACTLGSNWGYSGEKLWVSKGCRGTFNVTIEERRGGGGGGRGGGRDNSEIVTCASWDNRQAICRVRRDIDDVILERKHSNAACIEGSTWGVDFYRNYIWVSQGCRADFRVYYRRGRW